MKKFAKIKEIGENILVVFKVLSWIGLWFLSVVAIALILLSASILKEEIQNAQLPTEAVEIPPGITVSYFKGGWILWQDFVIVNKPGLFGDSKEWVREYDREHPLDPEVVKKILEKEKNAKTHLKTDKYTEEQKKDNRVAYDRTFFQESTVTPRDWDGRQRDDWYHYKEHIILRRYGSVEGFDIVERLPAEGTLGGYPFSIKPLNEGEIP